MQISDVARLAGVSKSTVSKVLNGKDDSISLKTREKVLHIAKKYNYRPYHSVLSRSTTKTYTIALLLPRETKTVNNFLSVFSNMANESGYSILVYLSSSTEEEYRNTMLLTKQNVDAIIWEKSFYSNSENEKLILSLHEKLEIICYETDDNNYNFIDYSRLGFNAAYKLVENNHKKILSLTKSADSKEQLFVQGVRKCLQQHNIPFTERAFQALNDHTDGFSSLLLEHTAVVCSNIETAQFIFEEIKKKKWDLSEDLSIISLCEDDFISKYPISNVQIPTREFSEYICKKIIGKIENTTSVASNLKFTHEISYFDMGSVINTLDHQSPKIMVVGTVNIDYTLSLNSHLMVGETIVTNQRTIGYGGKGLNQAIGAAKLGADVFLIGKTGKDIEGSDIRQFLNDHCVNTEGVIATKQQSTGNAYIHVHNDGESSILVYEGANSLLSTEDIDDYEKIFKHMDYCLIQTELREEVVLHVAKKAQKYGVKTILKPAANKNISVELLKYINILVPNERESIALSPESATLLEDQASYFISLGVQTVIITCGADGCYLFSKGFSKYFKAADFIAVDTTGASDAFISSLAVFLSNRMTMEESVFKANFSAGYSVTKRGVPNSLIDKTTIDFYFGENIEMRNDDENSTNGG